VFENYTGNKNNGHKSNSIDIQIDERFHKILLNKSLTVAPCQNTFQA